MVVAYFTNTPYNLCCFFQQMWPDRRGECWQGLWGNWKIENWIQNGRIQLFQEEIQSTFRRYKFQHLETYFQNERKKSLFLLIRNIGFVWEMQPLKLRAVIGCESFCSTSLYRLVIHLPSICLHLSFFCWKIFIKKSFNNFCFM